MIARLIFISLLAGGVAAADDNVNVILQVSPAEGSPVDLYGVPVGSKTELVFHLPVHPLQIRKAQLAMMVDDIDSREEASIRLNGGKPLLIPDKAIAEGQFHPAFMDVPTGQLRNGRNVFKFCFDSNLGNSTQGFVIDESYLILTALLSKDAIADLNGVPGIKTVTADQLTDVHAVFKITGRKELPGGFEIPGPFLMCNLVNGSDGSILAFYGDQMRRSTDGGLTWSDAEKIDIGVNGVTRLNSGLLGARMDMTFHVSPDDGKTWEKRGDMASGARPRWEARGVGHYDVMIQTKSGRILMPVRGSAAANEWLAQRSAARALYKGKEISIEGHAHRPEADFTIVYFSDDEGRSWRKADGTIMIWKDDGHGGMWPADEPIIIDLKNGDVMLYFRTTLGRIYTARSTAVQFTRKGGPNKGQVVKTQPGEYFDYPQPTSLSASYTPCRVRRIPSTGDLLLIWNQVSTDEMRGGHSRGRLSTAISKDDGKTWQHYRTFDRTVLAPTGRVEPESQPAMARALKFIGEITPGYGHVDYPNLLFHEDKVLVTWLRGIQYPRAGEPTGARLRVVPLTWFYEDEPAYTPPTPMPKLYINDTRVPGLFIDDGFLVAAIDVAAALGIPVQANMIAPLHQVLTHLKQTPKYDRLNLHDPESPVLYVKIIEP